MASLSDKFWHHFLTRLGSLRRRGNNTLARAPDTSAQREQVRAFVPGPPHNAGAQPVTIFPRAGFGPHGHVGFGLRGRNGFGS